MVLHGKARPQAATIEIKAEDANIGITAGPMPCIAPSQNTILDDQIPLLSRTAEGLANLAQKLQAWSLSCLSPIYYVQRQGSRKYKPQ